jgi:hypothetical protein
MKGAIISKDRHNVGDDSQFQYIDTNTPLFKLYKSDKGSRVYSSYSGTDLFVIPHFLGYIPMFFLYADRLNNQSSNPVRKIVYNIDTALANAQSLWTCYADENYINVTVTKSDVAFPLNGTYEYNFFIFYDRVG